MGLDPARRLVVFACRSPSTYSHNITVATRLAEAIDNGRLGQPAQLVVRPHPINFRSDHRRPMFEYLDLAERFPNVTIDIPAVSSDRLSCDVPESDYRRLAALLAHCDVLVNAFSTTTLEAFLLDKPVVLVSDEAHLAAGLPDDSPESRAFHLDTHAPGSRGWAPVATTFDELIEAVTAIWMTLVGTRLPAPQSAEADAAPPTERRAEGGRSPRRATALGEPASFEPLHRPGRGGSARAGQEQRANDRSAFSTNGSGAARRGCAGCSSAARGRRVSPTHRFLCARSFGSSGPSPGPSGDTWPSAWRSWRLSRSCRALAWHDQGDGRRGTDSGNLAPFVWIAPVVVGLTL